MAAPLAVMISQLLLAVSWEMKEFYMALYRAGFGFSLCKCICRNSDTNLSVLLNASPAPELSQHEIIKYSSSFLMYKVYIYFSCGILHSYNVKG